MASYQPLAETLRPKTLDDIIGQDHLVGKNGFITKIIQSQIPLSILLWGPPGCGKTSIARLYAKAFSLPFESVSPIFTGIPEIKKMVLNSKQNPLIAQRFLLFVDEIHRFNKAQQDAFLPFVEDGSIILIGATAENPSFYLNSALLSRLRVLKLNSLDDQAISAVLQRYESEKSQLPLTPEARDFLIRSTHGDARYLWNLVENIRSIKTEHPLSVSDLATVIQQRAPLFDKTGDQHHQLISALHKSVRGSDPDASLYWFCRMIEGGEDPLYIARRMIRMASEDIGLADPNALTQAIAARDAYEMLGSPEGELALAQAVVYLALAPKSNSVYVAYNECLAKARQTHHQPPPSIIINGSTKMMKEMGYGKDYLYDHDLPEGFSGQTYFPDGVERETFYRPVERGFEREMNKRIRYFSQLRHKRLNSRDTPFISHFNESQ